MSILSNQRNSIQHHHMRIKLSIAISALLCGALTAAPAFAQSPTPTTGSNPTPSPTTQQQGSPSATPSTVLTTPTDEASITSVSTREVEGEVMKISGNTLTLETASETLELQIPESIQIDKDGQSADVSQIEPGDHVKATIDEDANQVLTLEITSPQNWWMQPEILLPVIVGLLLLGVIVYWIIKRSTRSNIKTTTTNIG